MGLHAPAAYMYVALNMLTRVAPASARGWKEGGSGASNAEADGRRVAAAKLSQYLKHI